MSKYKIAILDDYQDVAKSFADWTLVTEYAEIEVFTNHLHEEDEIVARLKHFEIICVMRERTPLTPGLLMRLPNLKLIVSTGARNRSIDLAAAEKLGIEVQHTGYLGHGALELTWALLMAIAKHIPQENANLRAGGWQHMVGNDLKGRTLGILGLGNLGAQVAAVAKVFDMDVIAWSENLTPEKAIAGGARYVDKKTLFQEADYLTVHMVLSDRSKGIVGADDLALMKPTAYLINTSRGPLVDENALIKSLEENKIAGAALDVFDKEPLDENHPFRKLKNVLATPHIGFVTQDTYNLFFNDIVKVLLNWLPKHPKK
ncbi:phosphoglycerate dehydrogenase-like enzyme [Pedobacter sp. W3I1]|uniref:D-2-hydroxyacid dehydrogenase family protein n=1 Tax=Pedobacter sp. W3I1 TaxID=3042291 RepID=UPI00277D79CF|nr:D-2-hydroxyacid dehydrogenase family protein [Pedobacter sp. W3I1]MDQ0640014.1 phosphoglycerate dehydrogenase-like enzyme [Pedobacter sp. W3I1]